MSQTVRISCDGPNCTEQVENDDQYVPGGWYVLYKTGDLTWKGSLHFHNMACLAAWAAEEANMHLLPRETKPIGSTHGFNGIRPGIASE